MNKFNKIFLSLAVLFAAFTLSANKLLAQDATLDMYFQFVTEGWDGSVENGQCGPSGTLNGNSGWASTPIAGVYFDDTDNRAGGCPQSYRVVSAGSASVANKFRVCRNVTQSDGNGQCGAIGTSCSEWTGGAGAWSAPYGDDTDNRSGWCQVQFLLQEYITSPADAPYVFRLKVESYATPGSDNTQCQGVTQQHPALEYTGWTHAPAWTTGGILDDTDKRGGGCQRRWTVERTQRPGWVAKCANSLDDDADGWIDLEDPGCANSQDNDEGNGAVSQCSDRIDNDSDGFIDSGDPDCANGFDNLEQGPAFQRPVCPGGVTPQVIDIEVAPARAFQTIQQAPGTVWATNTKSIDPQNGDRIFVSGYSLANTNFASHYSNFYAEFRTPYAAVGQQYVTANCKRAIGNSLPVEISGLFLGPLNPNANPTNFTTKQIDVCGWGVGGTPYYVNIFRCQKPQCADQIDNDLDNMTDLYDPGCANANDNDELNNLGTQCSDGIDNDGDGFIDLSDAGCEGLTDTTESPRPPAVGCTTVTNGAIPSSFYQSFENYSPINNTKCGPYSYFHLENFSDGAFNTPGIVAGTDDPKIGLEVFGADSPPNANGYPVADYIDSVLADGATSIEGYCNIKDKRCSSFFFRPHQVAATGPYTNTMFMTFKCNELTGGCPTHAGFVWTDGAVGQTLNVKWYTPSGVLIAETNEVVGAQNFSYQGSAGEDKFFGAVNPGEGIGKVVLRTTHPTIEVGTEIDHIQYGRVSQNQCNDKKDNDGDGLVDLNDPGCEDANDQTETDPNLVCDNAKDDDGDLLTDFARDPGCASPEDDTETNPNVQCDDGLDNDKDGLVDYPKDPGCESQTDKTEGDPNVPACRDLLDNDGDGLIDHGKDPGCDSPNDLTEFNSNGPACDNGRDDDGDMLVDMLDPGCSEPTDTSERNENGPACDNGKDDDKDGVSDYPRDPGCDSLKDNDEKNPNGFQCDNGKDDDGDGKIDFPEDPQCSSLKDDSESGVTSECNDNQDNDNDGLKDFPIDPGCYAADDPTEKDRVGGTACDNDLDDDRDGLIDFRLDGKGDPGCFTPYDQTEDEPQGFICDNGIDDDGDLAIDFPMDLGCASRTDDSERNTTAGAPDCDNGLDDDLDKYSDFPLDPGCSSAIDPTETNPNGPQCDNGRDDDSDTFVDMKDPGCSSPFDDSEKDAKLVCDNGLDDDGDLVTDFPRDPGCDSPSDSTETNANVACDDGVDNDGDKLTDYPDDPGCLSPTDKSEDDPDVAACKDGIDNDGDSLVDFPTDPGCSSPDDLTEFNPSGPACDNGRDDDGDDYVDMMDPGCADPKDTSEDNASGPQCDDGLDNDKDGYIDYPKDPGCTSLSDNDERGSSSGAPQCDDGIDNDGDGKIDFPNDPECASPNDNSESQKGTECKDGIDNDKDGLIDFGKDPGCLSTEDQDETNNAGPDCDNANDDDRDGLIDFKKDNSGDPGCENPYDDSERDAQGPLCDNRIDDDGDLLIDFPADPGCSSRADNDERNNTANAPQCDNGKDDDLDGLTDFPADPGCESPADTNEKDTTANPIECDDGKDNDLDGKIDYRTDNSGDPGCFSAYDPSEKNADGVQCDNGKDDDNDGKIDFRVDNAGDPGCSVVTDNDETDNSPTPTVTPTASATPTITRSPIPTVTPNVTVTPDVTVTPEATVTPKPAFCADGIDNDADGKIDLQDPGCSGSEDNDEQDTLQAVVPILECVIPKQDQTFIAVFGYDNKNTTEQNLEVSSSGSTGTNIGIGLLPPINFGAQNAFDPSPASRGQPTKFSVGRKTAQFQVPFDGNNLTWTVQPLGAPVSSVTASRTSPVCGKITAEASCRTVKSDGTFEYKFAYVNENSFPLKVPVGELNKFSPGAEDRGQPTEFFAGRVVEAIKFSTTTDTVTWNLLGIPVVANSSLASCEPCTKTSLVGVKKTLDQTAIILADATKQAADSLTKVTKKVCRNKALKEKMGLTERDCRIDSTRALKKAVELQEEVRRVQLQFPEVSKTCPELAEQCSALDNIHAINGLKGLYVLSGQYVKRMVTRATFLSKQSTTPTKLIKSTNLAVSGGLDALNKVPRFSQACAK